MTTFVHPARPALTIRRIALPTEHGGWSLAGEPLILALLAAPSAAGFYCSVAAMMAFLARQPVKIFLGDLYRGRLFPRSKTALAVAAAYAVAGVIALAMSVSLAGTSLLWPILFAFPFAAVQIAYDGANESRGLLPEICGATSIASAAAMIALAGNAGVTAAYILWLLAASRNVTAILYVRSRLKLERDRRGIKGRRDPGGPLVPFAAHAALLLFSILLIAARGFHWQLAAAALLLAARCVHGLTTRSALTAKQVGVREIAYGAAFAFLAGSAAW